MAIQHIDERTKRARCDYAPELVVCESKWTSEKLRPFLGQWVFFAKDGSRVLASAVDLDEAYRKLEQAGFLPDDTLLDHLVDADEISVEFCETALA